MENEKNNTVNQENEMFKKYRNLLEKKEKLEKEIDEHVLQMLILKNLKILELQER